MLPGQLAAVVVKELWRTVAAVVVAVAAAHWLVAEPSTFVAEGRDSSTHLRHIYSVLAC